jgi:WD40 repeat protein
LNISKGGKITTGGESKTLFTSLKSVNEGIVGLQKKATFKSPINALEFISENIVAVGLEDSSLWLIKLDTNEKTKIFKSKGWKPGKVIKTITNTFVKGINFVEYSSKNRTLIASLEKELIVIDFDKINDGKKAFTNKFELNNLETDEIIVSMSYSETSNTFFLATSMGNVILFDLEAEKLLKFNNKLLNIVNETAVEIEFYNNTVFVGTKEGSVYIYEYNKNKKLRYLRSKRANFSQVSDILFDNNTLYTLTKNGDLTILSYSENAAGEKKMKTPVSINFGEKIFGNVIESFTYQGIQYFVTADSSGNLVYWDLDLENTFDRIKQLYAKKYTSL